MILGRRSFLAGSGMIAGGGFLHSISARASAHSVSDLGVRPDADEDVSAALEKAISEISAAGEAVYLPGGTYRASSVSLPENAVIAGVSGQTRLVANGDAPVFMAKGINSLHLSGLMIEGSALHGSASDVMIDAIRISKAPGHAIALTGSESLTISRCRFETCADTAIDVSMGSGTAVLTSNQIANCKTGISLKGNGHVTGNAVSGASEFGLRLGGGPDGGAILADGNILNNCAIGIGVTANEETLLVSLNLINGMTGATSAAIRAFSGNELVGPDLVFESSEAYLNLTVVGNVAR